MYTPELQPNVCLGSEGADPVHRVQKDRGGALAVRGHYKGPIIFSVTP